MQLENIYRYVGLDFETTGLDNTKDEPIQIGIVEIDQQGKIIDEYVSLIKPQKKTDELKQIVGFITGLSIQDLETAPSRDTVAQDIKRFFGPNTILIGHNVTFDKDFLDIFFPGMPCQDTIDTFQLSQALVHYAPSHALEVLVPHLSTKEPEFTPLLTGLLGETHTNEKSHDALYDTKESLALFLFLSGTIQKLIQNYPAFEQIRAQSEGIFAKIFPAQPVAQVTIQFPSLQKIAPSHTSIEKNKTEINRENHKRYYIGNTPIKKMLSYLAGNKDCILAFQNIQKLDIAKGILNDLGIKNIGFIKEEQTINETMFKDFLNKGHFSEEEFLFISKYLSQLQKGYGTLDLNAGYNHKIYQAIKDTREKTKYPVVLATHTGIYTMLEEQQTTYATHDIFFFDTERWYKTYNFFLSRPYDMYYTLNALESLRYKWSLKQQIQESKGLVDTTQEKQERLEKFYQLFQIFMGVIFSDTKKIFTNTDANFITVDPIIGHSNFHQTSLLREQLTQQKEEIEQDLDEEEQKLLMKQLAHLEKILNGIVNINKKMYNQSDFYFVYAEAQRYTDRKEFIDIFTSNVYFLSNSNQEYLPISIDEEAGYIKTKIPTRNLERIDAIIQEVSKPEQADKNIFIFSPKKEESKKIFEEICEKDIHKDALMLVENITGGIGKNIFKATGSGKKIIIGGNNFLLYLYANNIRIDEVILFNSKGGSEDAILQDIQRYYPK